MSLNQLIIEMLRNACTWKTYTNKFKFKFFSFIEFYKRSNALIVDGNLKGTLDYLQILYLHMYVYINACK
jgi:hypothetical protein